MKMISFLRKKKDRGELPPERRLFRVTVWSFVGMFAILLLSSLTAFLLVLRGPEETMVPDVAGDELVEALVSLQERGLFPHVQLRYFSDPALKGRVVTQNPAPGSVVRVGRRVNLMISQGAIIEEVADYRGMMLSDVQAEIQELGSGSTRVLSIGNVSNVFDESQPGTVIAQHPEAGTQLSGSTTLDLVVSRGPDVDTFSLPTYLGLEWNDALQVLARDKVPFVFKLEDDPTSGRSGVVVGQDPEPGVEIDTSTPVTVVIRDDRDVPSGYEFGIFDRRLPDYAVTVELTAVAVGPEGETTTLFAMDHPGGRLAFPYELQYGSVIILYRFDTEVIRFPIMEPVHVD
ncbi:MAG: PASTA domain-containing protein [Spirochaetaceae bacterium]|nr:MAG: PASTA domain-containing protein [Spirochaetaceae bacterium]